MNHNLFISLQYYSFYIILERLLISRLINSWNFEKVVPFPVSCEWRDDLTHFFLSHLRSSTGSSLQFIVMRRIWETCPLPRRKIWALNAASSPGMSSKRRNILTTSGRGMGERESKERAVRRREQDWANRLLWDRLMSTEWADPRPLICDEKTKGDSQPIITSCVLRTPYIRPHLLKNCLGTRAIRWKL